MADRAGKDSIHRVTCRLVIPAVPGPVIVQRRDVSPIRQ